jgi:hypothetical protein
LPPPPNNPRFFSSSNLKNPPLVFLLRLDKTTPPSTTPTTNTMVKSVCSAAAPRTSKNIFLKLEMVSFGLIFGGDATTFGIVSRIDVRDGMMKFPVMVVSQ